MLYFHEKCSNDVQKIIAELKTKNADRAKDFLTSLLKTYQDIYSLDFNHNELWDYNTKEHFSYRINIIGINNFPYVVIFMNNHKGKMIVLSIQYNRKSMTQII